MNTYDSSNANAALKHDLLTVTSPNAQSGGPDAGDSLTNTYNSSGQVTSQSDPMGRVTSYNYAGINPANLTGTVVVTDPDANETAYTFNDGTLVQTVAGYGSAPPSSTTYAVDASTLLDDSVTDANNNTSTYTYNTVGDLLTKTNPLSQTWTYTYNSFDEVTCATEPLSANPCSALSPPSAITAGTATITPPGSAAPKYATYIEYDTDANKIYSTTGDYAPGSGSASQSRTSYDLYNGQSVTLGGANGSCTNTAPSTELPCATIDPDAVVTQLGYNAAGSLTSKSTPDGNAGGELATTIYGYDSDGEQTSTVAPDGNLSGANAGNFTTSSVYNADGEVTSQSVGAASGHNVVPRVSTNTYDADGNRIASTKNTSPDRIGVTSGSNSSSTLALTLPAGTLVGDEVILSTTTSPASGSETVTTPSGYTLIDSKNTGQTTTYVYTHTVVGGDTGVTLSYSTTDAKVASLAVYRGLNTLSPIDVYDDATTASGTTVGASALTTTALGDELVLIAGAGQQGSAGTWSAPGSMTSEAQAQLSGTSSILADGPGPAGGGSTGAETATASVSGQLAAIFLALTPGTVTTTTPYDADDEATLLSNPDGATTLTCYDGDGHVAEVVPPVGVAANTLTASSCPTGYPSDYGDRLASDATTISYNALGDKATMTTPAPAGLSGYETTTYAYDPAGRLTSISAPPTSTSGGAPDDVTAYSYDAAGQLLTATTGSGTAAASITSYCYDPDGNKTASVAPDGNTSAVASCSATSPYGTSSPYQTAYSYDSLGELVTKTAPTTTWAASGQVTTDTYDPAGNQLSTEDPNGVTTTDTYTPLDQVATVSYSGSAAHSVTYTYDANANQTAMTDASGSSTSTYDPFDELTATTNGASLTTTYSYDASGDTTGITYPLGAGATWANTDTLSYGYDAAGELASMSDFNGNTSVITNTADGLASSISLGASGDVESTTYAPTDLPSAIDLTQGATTLLGFSYADAPSGAIVAETDTPSSTLSPADYTYDAQSRVTQMTPGSTSALTYAYDASSNLTTLPNGATGTYDHASELTSAVKSGTTTTYTFNADGERTEASVGGTATVNASYNGAEELTSYSDSAADTSSATYDGDGLRTAATTTPTGGGATTQSFVWNETTSVPELLMDSGNAYLYGPSRTPIEQVNLSTGSIQYLAADGLGSVRGVISSSGSLTASTSYDAEGNPETAGGLTGFTPIGFAGGYTDPTGVLYLVHRYYDPATGQFLSVDPAVSITGQPYAYTGDDPVNASDPTGLCVSTPFGCIGPGPANGISGTVGSIVNGVSGAAKEGAHLTIDAVTDPFYLEYWGALDLNGAIHWGLGSAFGSVGCDIANVIGAPLVPFQAQGLGVDIAGDWLKQHVLGIPDYTVGDEGKPSAYLLGSQLGPIAQKLGVNWRHNFPGVHSNGSVDWWW